MTAFPERNQQVSSELGSRQSAVKEGINRRSYPENENSSATYADASKHSGATLKQLPIWVGFSMSMYAELFAYFQCNADSIQRKIEGPKLCKVIAKDVHKRFPSNSGHKVALRDPGVELDVSGKAISDEGFAEVAFELADAIKYRDDEGRILRLEEICLKGNLLTVQSLAHLATVISLSDSELRDLDLSNNQIKITTQNDAAAWERFLCSFAQNCVLRRLDLSGNPLGFKGHEILSKVYTKEYDWSETEQSPLKGLRSVPYIILSDTCLNDVSATHLSYIVANHRLTRQLLPLVPQAKAGAPVQQLEAYDQVEGCNGIVWKPNEELGTSGLRVLGLAEATRRAAYDPTVDPEADPSIPTELIGDMRLVDPARTPVSSKNPVTPVTRHRRDSACTPISASQNSPMLNSSELDRARSRIQGDTLKEQGLRTNDLWFMSMKMLKYARIILLEPKYGYVDEIIFSHSPSQSISSREFKTPKAKRRTVSGDVFESLEAFPALPSVTATPTPSLKRPLANGNPNTSIFPQLPGARKNSLVHSSSEMPPFNPPMSTSSGTRLALPPLQTQTSKAQRMLAAPYRSDLPGGLPGHVWTQILGHVVGAHGILHLSQQRAVARWGTERSTLHEERGVLGKPEAEQIWRVLSGMGCLAYGDGRMA